MTAISCICPVFSTDYANKEAEINRAMQIGFSLLDFFEAGCGREIGSR